MLGGGLLAITVLMGCRPEAQDSPVLVLVNGKPITQSEFDYRWAALPESTQARYKLEGGKRKFLDDLVSRELLLQEARKRGLDRSLSVRDRVERYREQLVLDELMNQTVKTEVKVSDAELEAYSVSHAAGPPLDATARERLRHELFAEKHRQRYEELLARLRATATIRMADASKFVIQDAGRLPSATTP